MLTAFRSSPEGLKRYLKYPQYILGRGHASMLEIYCLHSNIFFKIGVATMHNRGSYTCFQEVQIQARNTKNGRTMFTEIYVSVIK